MEIFTGEKLFLCSEDSTFFAFIKFSELEPWFKEMGGQLTQSLFCLTFILLMVPPIEQVEIAT